MCSFSAMREAGQCRSLDITTVFHWLTLASDLISYKITNTKPLQVDEVVAGHGEWPSLATVLPQQLANLPR